MKKLVFVQQDNCVPCQQLKPLVVNCCLQLGIPLEYENVTDNWARAVELNVKSTPWLIVMLDNKPADIIESRRAVPLLAELSTKFDLLD